MHREYYKTFEFMVRVPISSNSRATRITRVRIDATDSHSAKCLALGQYGDNAVITPPMQIRKWIYLRKKRMN